MADTNSKRDYEHWPSHFQPEDADDRDDVEAAWNLRRFQKHETQDEIHQRLGQWPLVQQIRKDMMRHGQKGSCTTGD